MSYMSNLDIIAQESIDFADFKKQALEEYPKIDRSDATSTDKWLTELYENSKND